MSPERCPAMCDVSSPLNVSWEFQDRLPFPATRRVRGPSEYRGIDLKRKYGVSALNRESDRHARKAHANKVVLQLLSPPCVTTTPRLNLRSRGGGHTRDQHASPPLGAPTTIRITAQLPLCGISKVPSRGIVILTVRGHRRRRMPPCAAEAYSSQRDQSSKAAYSNRPQHDESRSPDTAGGGLHRRVARRLDIPDEGIQLFADPSIARVAHFLAPSNCSRALRAALPLNRCTRTVLSRVPIMLATSIVVRGESERRAA